LTGLRAAPPARKSIEGMAMPNEHLVETVRGAIEWAALGIEVLARW